MGRSNAVLVVLTIFLATFLGPESVRSGDAVPPVHLFSLPTPVLRASPPYPAAPKLPADAPTVPPTENFALQTRKAPTELELSLQRHEAMNGRPLLESSNVRRAAGFQRTFDLLLPPKASLFQKNPNARRDPLVIDGW